MTETRQTNGVFGGDNTILIDDMDIYLHRLIVLMSFRKVIKQIRFKQSVQRHPFFYFVLHKQCNI